MFITLGWHPKGQEEWKAEFKDQKETQKFMPVQKKHFLVFFQQNDGGLSNLYSIYIPGETFQSVTVALFWNVNMFTW